MNQATTTNNFKINFYNNLEMAISAHSEYMLYLAQSQDKESVEEEVLEKINVMSFQLKNILHRLHIQLLTLDTKRKYSKEEKELYSPIKKSTLLDEEKTEEYILMCNKFLIEEIGEVSFNDVAEQL